MTVIAPAIIRCIGQVVGCPLCEQEPLRQTGTGRHVCDELCGLQKQNRATPDGHAHTHEPVMHSCGEVLDDRLGHKYEIQMFCGYGTCVQYFCPGCHQFTSGFGPVGCQCEDQPCAHGSAAALAAPRPGRKPRKTLFARLRRA